MVAVVSGTLLLSLGILATAGLAIAELLLGGPLSPTVAGIPVLALTLGAAGLGIALLGSLGLGRGWAAVAAAFLRSPDYLPWAARPAGREPRVVRVLAVVMALGAMAGGVWLMVAGPDVAGVWLRGAELLVLGGILAWAAVTAIRKAGGGER